MVIDNMRSAGSSHASRTNRQRYQSTTRQVYIDGNTARKLQPLPQQRTRTAHQGTRHNQKRRMKVSPMNLGYISFMIASVLVVCVVLMGYINLQSDITNRVTHISKMESELNNLKLANDETYTKIMSNVDLDEIKRIAIGELGMKYAKEGQVITYSGEGSDYVRQYGDIPE